MLSLQPLQIFITGCPRSGTTALLRWVESHKKVVGFGETRILLSSHYFWREVKKHRMLSSDKDVIIRLLRNLIAEYYSSKKFLWGHKVIDKLPLEPVVLDSEPYKEFIQNVKELLPRVKIIFMIRNPVSTVWSMKNREWGRSLTIKESRRFTLETCIHIWKANANIIAEYMDDPFTYICKFENLVSDPEREVLKIEAFLDLKDHQSFLPKPTQQIGFTGEERKQILENTCAERKLFSY
jgi:hypothetical protein